MRAETIDATIKHIDTLERRIELYRELLRRVTVCLREVVETIPDDALYANETRDRCIALCKGIERETA